MATPLGNTVSGEREVAGLLKPGSFIEFRIRLLVPAFDRILTPRPGVYGRMYLFMF